MTGCNWDQERAMELYRKLVRAYSPSAEEFVAWKLRLEQSSPFEILVGIVLSQNTSDKNAFAAMERLRKLLGDVTPEAILRVGTSALEEAVRPAGMHRQRARTLVALAKFVYQHRGWLEELRSMDVEEARRYLMRIPGIGPKTADVFLLMYLGKATFPVDTHIARISARLGIVRKGARYEEIRSRYLELLPRDPELLARLHVLLITHGRRVCRARNPRCNECPLRDLCCSPA